MAVTATSSVDLLVGLAVLAFILCRQLQVRSASLLLYFGVTFTIQRLILQARAQRIAGSSPRNTGVPTASW